MTRIFKGRVSRDFISQNGGRYPMIVYADLFPPLGEDEAARGGVEDGDGEDTAGDTQPPEIQRGQCQCFRQTQQRGNISL